MAQPQQVSSDGEQKKFVFTKTPRAFPVVDSRPYRWPSSAREADELVGEWSCRAGTALGRKRLSKATMVEIASHTSRKDGTVRITDAGLSSRTGRSIPSTKRDIGRLKKMGFLIAEIIDDKGYRKRRRTLHLSVPDVVDDDQRIAQNDDQRIASETDSHWRSTYTQYVDTTDQGELRDV